MRLVLRRFSKRRRIFGLRIIATYIKPLRPYITRSVYIRRIFIRGCIFIPLVPLARISAACLPQRYYSITGPVLGKVRYCPLLSVHGKHYIFITVLIAYIGCGKRTEGVYVSYLRARLAGKFLIQRRHRLAVKHLAVSAIRVTFYQYVADVYRSARYIGTCKSKYVINIIKRNKATA